MQRSGQLLEQIQAEIEGAEAEEGLSLKTEMDWRQGQLWNAWCRVPLVYQGKRRFHIVRSTENELEAVRHEETTSNTGGGA